MHSEDEVANSVFCLPCLVPVSATWLGAVNVVTNHLALDCIHTRLCLGGGNV